uniref:RING-type E3 ubiquitin transferase n=1 Tax=Astyanax mexicanus TaxID=7994 RepID=A0A8B9K3G5_ASTMX
ENSSSWRQAYTNSGYSSSPASPEHLCKACGGQFDTERRNVCVDCRKQFCGRCWVRPELVLCHTCQRFHGTQFERSELMRLKVKELRDYLHLHEIPTQTCREKEELVELVLGQHPPSSSKIILYKLLSNTNTNITIFQDTSSTDSEETLVHSRRASLSDLSSVQDIEGLSVRQLKEILARNFVNFKGCCEKWELMERVTRLFNDQKDLHNLVSNTTTETGTGTGIGQEENLCKICMDSPIDCVLLECGHMVTCSKCGKRMSECPICRQYVVRAVHVFRS